MSKGLKGGSSGKGTARPNNGPSMNPGKPSGGGRGNNPPSKPKGK